MEQLRYLATVANLEGLQSIDLPDITSDASSLAHLDQRVRALEAAMTITPPPPIENPSWSSLVWRLWRLNSRAVRLPNVTSSDPTDEAVLQLDLFSPEDTKNITMDVIKDTIGRCTLYVTDPAWPKMTTDDNTEFSIVLQRLAHMQGKDRKLWNKAPTTMAGLYAAAAKWLFECEAKRYPGVGVPPPPGWHNVWQPRRRATKGCCGCCACNCHDRSFRKRVPPGVRIYHLPKRRVSGLMRKLMFWRRDKKDDRDDGSSTTSTMLVD